jgi:hypothetical protein
MLSPDLMARSRGVKLSIEDGEKKICAPSRRASMPQHCECFANLRTFTEYKGDGKDRSGG